jgi:hypothetical protein
MCVRKVPRRITEPAVSVDVLRKVLQAQNNELLKVPVPVVLCRMLIIVCNSVASILQVKICCG